MPVLHTYVHMYMYELSYHGTFVGHYMSMSKMGTLYTVPSEGVSDKRQRSLDISLRRASTAMAHRKRHFYVVSLDRFLPSILQTDVIG